MAPPRVPTHVGDRNEDRSVRLETTRGAETLPPIRVEIDLAAPHEVDDPVTGIVPRGPELRAARAARPTDKRIAHLEERADLLVDELLASRRFVRRFLWKVLGIVATAAGIIAAAYEAGVHNR